MSGKKSDKAQRSLVEWMPKRIARKLKTYIPRFKIESAKSIFQSDEFHNVQDQKVAESTGWKLLGRGCGRSVWDMGNGLVVKFSFGAGKSQNENEVHVFKKYADTKLFLPLVAYDKENYDWLVVPKASGVGSMSIFDSVMEALVGAGFDPDDSTNNFDLHEENVGLYNGNPVVIDAGWMFV